MKLKINLKTSLTFLLTFTISNFLFSQTKNFSDILPKGIVARPILDTLSYLPETLKQPVLNLLNEKKFDLTKCFIDKQIDKNLFCRGNTQYVGCRCETMQLGCLSSDK